MAKEEAKKKKVKVSTAIKRDLQNEKKRLRNKVYRSKVRTAIRAFEAYQKVIQTIDEADEAAVNTIGRVA